MRSSSPAPRALAGARCFCTPPCYVPHACPPACSAPAPYWLLATQLLQCGSYTLQSELLFARPVPAECLQVAGPPSWAPVAATAGQLRNAFSTAGNSLPSAPAFNQLVAALQCTPLNAMLWFVAAAMTEQQALRVKLAACAKVASLAAGAPLLEAAGAAAAPAPAAAAPKRKRAKALAAAAPPAAAAGAASAAPLGPPPRAPSGASGARSAGRALAPAPPAAAAAAPSPLDDESIPVEMQARLNGKMIAACMSRLVKCVPFALPASHVAHSSPTALAGWSPSPPAAWR